MGASLERQQHNFEKKVWKDYKLGFIYKKTAEELINKNRKKLGLYSYQVGRLRFNNLKEKTAT